MTSALSPVPTKESSGRGLADEMGVAIGGLIVFQSFSYPQLRITRTRAFCRPIQLWIIKPLAFMGFSACIGVQVIPASTWRFSKPLLSKSSLIWTRTTRLFTCNNRTYFCKVLRFMPSTLVWPLSQPYLQMLWRRIGDRQNLFIQHVQAKHQIPHYLGKLLQGIGIRKGI